MLINEIKKANMLALKNKETAKRAAYSVLINKYMLLEVSNRESGKEVTDADVVSLIQKTLKELAEEKEMYVKGGNAERAESTHIQIDALQVFMPKMMDEDKVRKIIDSLEDKSMKSVMQHFKENYQVKVDMSLVSRGARSL